MSNPAATSIDNDLAAVLGPETATIWSSHRGPQHSAVRVERVDGVPVAAVLTTRRPATLASKIARVWHAAGASSALGRLVDEVVDEARERGDAAVKWESHDAVPEGHGFTRMRTPYRSAPGTEGVDGYILWLRALPHDEPPYYSQTSTFTCSAVSALLASEIRGSEGFAVSGDDDANRDRELDFWRRASNYPSCEPIGLAVALRESLDDAAGTAPVEVFLDNDGPVLLESYPDGFDRGFRAELQANSLRKALGSDIAVHRERIPIGDVEARVRAGELALLLIDLEPMYGFAVPHWVLAHAAADGVIVIDDPWISVNWGETWVDAHELPIATADLDRMLAWGPDGYRGVVFLRRS
jgi:hypothetical protein